MDLKNFNCRAQIYKILHSKNNPKQKTVLVTLRKNGVWIDNVLIEEIHASIPNIIFHPKDSKYKIVLNGYLESDTGMTFREFLEYLKSLKIKPEITKITGC